MPLLQSPNLQAASTSQSSGSASGDANHHSNYYSMLKEIHQLLKPRIYLEIGCGKGKAIEQALPTTICIGVDPIINIEQPTKPNTHLFEFKSDEFFSEPALSELLKGRKLDLVYLDGERLFEFALRDFINIERFCTNSSVVILSDLPPQNKDSASRDSKHSGIASDRWKLLECLEKYRPDLKISFYQKETNSIVFISNLDPQSDVLSKNHFNIVREYIPKTYEDFLSFKENPKQQFKPSSKVEDALRGVRKLDAAKTIFHASRSIASFLKPEKHPAISRYQAKTAAAEASVKQIIHTPYLTPHGGRPGPKNLKMLAILLCYNDGDFLTDSIEALLENGHHILAWDHGSNDETASVLDKYSGQLLERHFLPREFDFYGLYAHVSRHIIENFADKYSWVSWPDMDEILEGPTRAKSYPEYVEEVIDSGSTYVQFDNYNYWFTEEDDYSVESPARRIRHYGLRPDCAPRIRAWRADVTNERWFNHNPLPGTKFPQNFKLRHYPMRTYEKALKRLISDRHNLRREDANVHYENMAKHLDKLTIRASSLHFDDGQSELRTEAIYPWEGMYRA